ncbi:NADP-dependent oxidoreductase [Ktedonobacter racemifer]|uniref:Alcohol dehydrogenase GroES domain protein n=1 Tax=Ktedonobacter racemifer DSM 44963 TaxID=485913 RepID=D6U2E5_KTERA|nr:NADP-dependent oxidoreductase [Ktedonobacter racemifer]EFH82813.1 Alcohol dehydrogenase GroES domain protein [Ktedonobacter racemifer DSM 44963]
MKAIVLHEYGPASKLKYDDFEDPKPAAGEVLVRVCATSINPADWMVRSGTVKDILPVEFPHILGCDLAGTVVEAGEGVTSFEPGDRVMAVALRTYAELCTVKATDLVKIPDGLEMTTAAALPLVNVTGDLMIRLGAKVQPGQTVLITGALGSVGRSAVFAASQIGARVIAGVRGKRLDAARQLPGVSEAIAIDDDAEIDKLGPLDCVADTVGGKFADKLLAKVKEGGAFGCFPKQNPQDAALYPTVHINTIFGQVDPATRAALILRYAEAVRDGKLTIPIDRIMPLADAAEAQVIAEKGGIAKIVLTA